VDSMTTIINADVLDGLSQIPDESVHCVITSPPYWGLRDYGEDGQIGLESTPDEYVTRMVGVFREVRRVLRDDGVCWLNLGDSYGNPAAGRNDGDHRADGRAGGMSYKATGTQKHTGNTIKHKDLVGIPWRVAFALQADGWWLRSDVIWAKPNPMPESVIDRPTKSHEYMFLLTKRDRYFYDADAIREQMASDGKGGLWGADRSKNATPDEYHKGAHNKDAWDGKRSVNANGRNKRTVWNIATQPYAEAHFATFPTKLVEPCLLAGSSEKGCCVKCGAPFSRVTEKTRTFESGSGKAGNLPSGKNGEDLQGGGGTLDVRRGPCVTSTTTGWEPTCECGNPFAQPCTVLDPFNGSGTVGVVAKAHGRRYIGIELNPEYCEMARKRIDEAPEQQYDLGLT